MFLIGLTGGIASGKSTVSAMLAERGASIIDADEIAREVVEPGSAGFDTVVAEFGPRIINASGQIDRKELGQIVFQEAEKRLRLERILHPLIKARTLEKFKEQQSKVVVFAVPLLVEAKVDYPFDLIVTTEAGEKEQLRRLTAERGLTEEEAWSRIHSQTDAATRIAAADIVLDTSGPVANLTKQVDELWTRVQLASQKDG